MKRGLRLVVGIAAASVALTAAIPATADNSQQRTETYLALGDSYAFAYNPLIQAAGRASDPALFVGYPNLVAKARDLNLTNAACPGETSLSMITGTRPDNGCQDYRAQFPLHVKYHGAQLKYAVRFLRSHHDTDLVTLQIGGNDVLLLQKQCATSTDPSCIQDRLTGVLSQMAVDLQTIYHAIRVDGRYQGPIVAVEYFSFDYRVPQGAAITYLVSRIDFVVSTVAIANGARVADVFDRFAAASAPFGGVPCLAGLQVITVAATPKNPVPTCDIHPSYPAGHTVIANAIKAVLPPPDDQD